VVTGVFGESVDGNRNYTDIYEGGKVIPICNAHHQFSFVITCLCLSGFFLTLFNFDENWVTVVADSDWVMWTQDEIKSATTNMH